MNYTPYVDFEVGAFTGHPIKRVGCMRCNDTIGSKDPKTGALYHWDHKRDLVVTLSDGSKAHLPICTTCAGLITEDDFPVFESALKYAWVAESVFQQGGATAFQAFSENLNSVMDTELTLVGTVVLKGEDAPIILDDAGVLNKAVEDSGVTHKVQQRLLDVTILRRS